MWRYQYFKDKAGQWRWRLLAANGRKVAVSGESFASRAHAERAARNVRANAGTGLLPVRPAASKPLAQALAGVARKNPQKTALRARF